MNDPLLIAFSVTGAVGVAGLLFIERRESQRRRVNWQTVRLRFGRDVKTDAVVGLLDRLAGLQRGATVQLDVEADRAEISHYLSSDRATMETLRGAVRALIPSLRFEPVKQRPVQKFNAARSFRLAGRLRVLQADGTAEASAGLLAALQPLGPKEHLLLRWQISPSRAHALPLGKDGQAPPAEHGRLLRAKNEAGVLRARLLLAAAMHPQRAQHLIARVGSVLRSRTTAYGYLRGRTLGARYLSRILDRRRLIGGDRYSSAELAGLLGWPIDTPALPGLSLGTSPLLMPSRRLPAIGRVLGKATWPGSERPIAQPVVGALSHALIAGPTGTGKSTLLTNLITADIAAGRGVVVIDGKGDTATGVLARIPADRAGDVILLDCAASGPQPGLRLFSGDNAELAADVVLGVLSDLFRDAWGPLSERYLRAGLVAVAHDRDGTLADVPYVYSDPIYRRKLVGRLRDPLTRATLAGFEAMTAGERAQQLAAPLNKLGALLGRPIVRTVLGQSEPKLDLRSVLRRRQILIVNLNPARVGAPASRLIGAVTVFALFQAVQGRSDLSERARHSFFVYIDEPRALGDLHMPLDALLEQARGLGVGVTLAPQSMTQLPKSVREVALTNVATRVVFRQHADDARLLARDLPGVTAEDLGDLDAYEAVARIGLGPGDVAAPVTLKTQRSAKPFSDVGGLRQAVAKRWGVELTEVDAALEKRHAAHPGAAAIGRRRRQP